jgi:uncharacterized protein YjiK
MQQQLHEAAAVAQVHKMIKRKPVLPVMADLTAAQFSMEPEMLLVVAQALLQMVQMDLQHLRVQVLPVLQRL